MKAVFRFVWKVLLAVLVLGAAALLLAFRSFNMPSESMMPTLQAGDYMAVSVTAYGISRFSLPGRLDLFKGRFLSREPERGDVVVFALPSDPNSSYVKRVIGLPGDTIQMKQGHLYINEKAVPREPAARAHVADPKNGQDVEAAVFKEALPDGRRYEIVETKGDKGPLDNTEPFKVPDGRFFAMGDNRDNSADSRGAPDQNGAVAIPFDNLIGRVELVFLSVPRNGSVRAPMRRVR